MHLPQPLLLLLLLRWQPRQLFARVQQRTALLLLLLVVVLPGLQLESVVCQDR
jgi:hypothetical protein